MPDDKTGLLVRIARLYKVFDFQEASPQVKFKIYMGMLKEMFFMLQKIQILEDELRDVENGLAMIDRGFYSFLQGKEQLNIDLNAHIRTFIEVRSYFQSA